MKHKIKHKLKHAVNHGKRQDKYKKIVIVFILVFIIALVGALMFLQSNVNTKSEETKEYIEEQDNSDDYQEEAEEKERIEAESRAVSEIKSMDAKIHELLKDNDRYYGIYYCDLNTGLEYSINGDAEFHAASTIKVPIAMIMADKLYNKEISEDTLIEYNYFDNEDGAGSLQGEILAGEKKEVIELMKYMIEESDNIATSMLKRNAGDVAEYIINSTSISAANDKNYITPKQSCMILKKLYRESEDNYYYKKVIEMMKETTSHDRIDKYIPRSIVAHKIGDYERYVNDIGIVYTENPYILVAYTMDVMEEGRENIAQISKFIYDIKTNS